MYPCWLAMLPSLPFLLFCNISFLLQFLQHAIWAIMEEVYQKGARQPWHEWVVPNNSDKLWFERCYCLQSSQRLGLAEMRVPSSPQHRYGEPTSYQAHAPQRQKHPSRKNAACTRLVRQMQLSLHLSIACIAGSFSATRNVCWLNISLWWERVTLFFVWGRVASSWFSLSCSFDCMKLYSVSVYCCCSSYYCWC